MISVKISPVPGRTFTTTFADDAVVEIAIKATIEEDPRLTWVAEAGTSSWFRRTSIWRDNVLHDATPETPLADGDWLIISKQRRYGSGPRDF